MHLVSFDGGFGRVEGSQVIPMGSDILDYLATGTAHDKPPVPLAEVRLCAPVPKPGKIIGVGFNYREHQAETGMKPASEPALFAKYATSVIGPGDVIRVPHATNEPDYEGELAVVIGKTASDLDVRVALDYVAGYMCCNDVTARDLIRSNAQWQRGKAIDTFLPCGPWLTSKDEIPDPQTLGIRSLVNGEALQNSNTKYMIWSVADLVSFISQTCTLEPGDIIATGTPAGVGAARKPPRFLQNGDEVVVEIDRIGRLVNPVARSTS